MKVVGVLCWYDEAPSWVAAAVAGFARFCDAIVACDGSYGLYPGARARSRPEQAEAVLKTCEAMDVECVVHQPKDVYWGNEVEKRNQSLRLAGALSPDWVAVVDADHHVMRVQPELVRSELEATDLNVATYTILSGRDDMADQNLAGLVSRKEIDQEWTSRERLLYRWTPDLTYGPAHYAIHGTFNGDVEWVRGPEMALADDRWAPIVPALDLDRLLVVHHRREDRALVRKQAKEGFSGLRDAYGVESMDALERVDA